MVELVKILEKRFKKQYSISDISGIYKSSFADYKKDRRNELIALFKNLGLEESLDMFKSVEGRVAKVYWFYEDEVEFVNHLYDEYSRALVPIRKRQYKDLEDEYAVKLYEDILRLFTRRKLSLEEAYNRTQITYNILDYPIRRNQVAIRKMHAQMEKITRFITEERLRNITSRNDDFAWIDYVNKSIEKQFNEYIHLYDVMSENRQCDINDYAEKQYMEMTEEELEKLENEEFAGLQVWAEWKSLPRVKELMKKKTKITGEPTDPHEIMEWIPRTNYTLKELHDLEVIQKELSNLYQEVEIKVQKECIANRDLQPLFKKEIEYEFKGLRSSSQLLQDSLIEIEEEKNKNLGVCQQEI